MLSSTMTVTHDRAAKAILRMKSPTSCSVTNSHYQSTIMELVRSTVTLKTKRTGWARRSSFQMKQRYIFCGWNSP